MIFEFDYFQNSRKKLISQIQLYMVQRGCFRAEGIINDNNATLSSAHLDCL